MEGSMVKGIQLKVTLARRQPRIEPINEASSSATWSTIGNSIFFCSFRSFLWTTYFSCKPLTERKPQRCKRVGCVRAWFIWIIFCQHNLFWKTSKQMKWVSCKCKYLQTVIIQKNYVFLKWFLNLAPLSNDNAGGTEFLILRIY